jgi:hypothetical protein
MIVDVSDVLIDWEQPVLIKTVTTTTIDFEPVETVTGRMQNCVVQVAEKENLNPDTIDWSKEYLMVHSQNNISIDELIEYYDADYRVISRGPWRGYGYTEVVAEETKEPVKEPTE